MVGERIAFLRRQTGMTQFELAKKLNISPSAVGMYERDRREPSARMLVSISKVFGITVDHLLTGNQLQPLGRQLCPCSIRKISDTAFQILFDMSMIGELENLSVGEVILQKSPDNEQWTTVMSYMVDSQTVDLHDTGLKSGCFVYSGCPGYFYRVTIKYCTSIGEGNDICTYTATMRC